MQFNVVVTWFFNRCGAQKQGGTAEYPPSPARLLEAMLAGAYQVGGKAIETARTAILFLECQKPPEIHAVEPALGTKFEHYVHNNVVQAFDTEEMNTRKLLNPTLLCGSDAQVVYSWTISDDAPLSSLQAAIEALYALGHGDDMAFARVAETVPPRPRHYIPVRGGTDAELRIPLPGFLADLELAHRNHDRSEVTSVHLQAYALEENLSQLRRLAQFELRQIESEKFYAIGIENTVRVAAWIRHAAIEALRKEVTPERLTAIAGHGGNNMPRLSYLPLPNVFGDHADKMIRRVTIFAPPELTDLIQLARNILPGRVLTDSEGNGVCRLAEARSPAVFGDYASSGTEFETVTPVILPHHLNKNHKISQRRVNETAKWFTEAGLPRPIALSAEPMRQKFTTNGYMRHLPQYSMRARFPYSVTGPISIGLGKWSGLGIFANLQRLQTDRGFATNDVQHEAGNIQVSKNSEASALSV
jgi:CRISPR-associated protein Csb2